METTIEEFIEERQATCLPSSTPVSQAAEAMRVNGTSWVLVVDADRLVGIFTERDFLTRVAAVNRPLDATTLAEVMTTDLETLNPGDDIRYAINKMAVGGFRHVPIIDGEGKPISVIRVRDVIDHMAKVFASVEGDGGERLDEWVDVGGG